MSSNPETTPDSFRERMAKFWAKVHRDLKRESDAGRGPWILTPAGRKWLAVAARGRNSMADETTLEYSGPMKPGDGNRQSKWCSEFDDILRAEWPNSVSLSEFARRFGYKGKGGSTIVRNHAVKLGLMEWPPTLKESA